jgi:hypothetical protein
VRPSGKSIESVEISIITFAYPLGLCLQANHEMKQPIFCLLSTSEIKISVVVDLAKGEQAVKAVHAAFIGG